VRIANTPAGLLARALATNPAGPLLTMYDDSTGERIELSATTLDNWVAKTANLLQDSGVEPGAVAVVLLPPHWQGAAILLGCWSAGVSVTLDSDPAEVAFASADRINEAMDADEVYGLSLAPFAVRMHVVPPGVTDYATEVRGHGDRFMPLQPVDPQAPALDGTSHADLVAAAAARAAEFGISAGDRVLAADPTGLDWLLAPLAAGATIVLCRNPDPTRLAERAVAERVTVTLGADVPGIRRAD
jgi:uncharacterized protein (TIGR03089 family)